jgi:hypothetical protein
MRYVATARLMPAGQAKEGEWLLAAKSNAVSARGGGQLLIHA